MRKAVQEKCAAQADSDKLWKSEFLRQNNAADHQQRGGSAQDEKDVKGKVDPRQSPYAPDLLDGMQEVGEREKP